MNKHVHRPEKIETQAQAIRHFISRMDIEMIHAILDDKLTYQDMDKATFISRLSTVFETFMHAGDTRLIPMEGNCECCQQDKIGVCFVGDTSRYYMSLIFETTNGTILNLYECRSFTFKPVDRAPKDRIWIDYCPMVPF